MFSKQNTIIDFTLFCPLIQAGDKSLADVVAHEISHSWTGNLVTNRNFEHFWLNEGFTVFVENKIVGRLHGALAQDFHSLRNLNDLRDCVSLSPIFFTFNPENR